MTLFHSQLDGILPIERIKYLGDVIWFLFKWALGYFNCLNLGKVNKKSKKNLWQIEKIKDLLNIQQFNTLYSIIQWFGFTTRKIHSKYFAFNPKKLILPRNAFFTIKMRLI